MQQLIDTKAISRLKYGLFSWCEHWDQLAWDMILFVAATHALGIYGLFTTQLHWYTIILAVVTSQLGMIGMTCGYHRLYAHRTYTLVSRPVELFLLFWATTDFSMSAINWVRDHRAHHKYTDTDKDPYNIKKGFWWAHIGWLCWIRDRPNSDVSDLEKDRVLVIQHNYFIIWAILFGWVLPTWVCGYFWGDYRGGFFIASMLKTSIQHHLIFSINSVAHYVGDTPFNDAISSRENLLCAIATSGEGYHNFHHEFPNDYRAGVHVAAYDPAKWCIASLELLGLATKVKRASKEQIRLCEIQMIQKRIAEERKEIFEGRPIDELPYYTAEEVAELCSKGESLVIEGDLVFDVTSFKKLHPGGSQYVVNNLGKDITKAFNGSVYTHSLAAKNILQTLRCGRLKPTSCAEAKKSA